MSNYLNKIESKREIILIGEIGALLHDIGKLHPDFIKSKSIEKAAKDYHAQIDKFVNPAFVSLIKNKKFEIVVGSVNTNIYNLITKHHEKKENKIDEIVKFLKRCDGKDSADDKGIIRKKQPINNTIISSPFGYPKEKIDLKCLQKRFEDLEDNLIGLFKNYIAGTIDLSCFRESLISNLKNAFSHALGETRLPSNDVTLWDHSYSTASLFKSLLIAKICGAGIDIKSPKWRIFGICWNGLEFINKGRKIAEIKARNDVIENIKRELKTKFEDEKPIGNMIYEDTNGIYFTFPDLADKSKDLAEECAEEALKIIYKESDSELWPFFTLSKASGTLTIIADELKFASEKRKIPKMSPTLFIEGKEVETFENPEIATPSEGQDVCPICRIRPKNVEKERCKVCEKRKEGRLLQWLSNRQDTIWIDEVADKNNRIALISLNFYLDKWLDGTMIGTIYSQSFEDWLDKEKENLSKIQNVLKQRIKKRIESLEKAIENMKKAKDPGKVEARITEKIKEKKELEQEIKQYTFTLIPEKETVYKVLDIFFKVKDNDREIAAKILNTFFQDVNITKDNLEYHINNIKVKEKIGADILTKENLATYLFTQNPSPARLYRIWQEIEEFFDLVINELENEIYGIKWKRVRFSIDYNKIISKLRKGKKLRKRTPYILQIDNLEPQKLLVFHNENGEFYTIESLGKFRFNNKIGEEAVREALKQGFKHLALEDLPDENLLSANEEIKPENDNISVEEYFPLIELNRSPLSLRLIVPASDSIKMMEIVTKLYNERFEKVIGKLPLNVKLLVAKRKFPLYVLLDAENRMLDREEFKKQVAMDVWWDINGVRNDKYRRFYPVKPIKDDEKYVLDNLSSISKEKIFYLYPGYFDLLLGTTDRYKIYYNGEKRGHEDYRLFTRRPYFFYQISEMQKLWNILSANISSSQINFIEEMITSKLREWRDITDGRKNNVFREFAEATLKDAFGDKWYKLRDETKFFLIESAINRLLLDTIIFFRHVIKVKEVDENV